MFNSSKAGLIIHKESYSRIEEDKLKTKPKAKTELVKALFLALTKPEALYYVSWMGKTRGSNSILLSELNSTLKDELKSEIKNSKNCLY